MHLCESKKSFIKIFSLILYLKLWTLVYGRFGILTWLGGLVWNLAVILTQTVGRFDMWVTPYTGILTLAKLKDYMSKDLSTKAL